MENTIVLFLNVIFNILDRIEVIWGPKICLFQRKINKLKIHDKRHDIYERAVTFDGPDFYSHDLALGGKRVSREIKRIVLEIRNNIRQLS